MRMGEGVPAVLERWYFGCYGVSSAVGFGGVESYGVRNESAAQSDTGMMAQGCTCLTIL